MNERFNFDNRFKQGFLEIVDIEQGENNHKRYTDLFNRVAKFENYNEKDLYDFTSYETQQYIYSYKSTDSRGMFDIANLIYRYQLLAFNNHKTRLVPKKLVSSDVRKLLDEFKLFNKFLTHREYLQLLRNLENAQDQATIVLAWNGILGVGLKDILNLKISNVDFVNNSIKYFGADNNEHFHQLEEWEMNIIKEAIHQDKYLSIKLKNVPKGKLILTNDEVQKQLEKRKIRYWGGIFITPYVLRKVGSYENVDMSTNPFVYAGLRTRLRLIQEMTLASDISLKSIQDSGIAYRSIKDELDFKSTNKVVAYIKSKKLYISAINLKKLIGIISKKIIKERETN